MSLPKRGWGKVWQRQVWHHVSQRETFDDVYDADCGVQIFPEPAGCDTVSSEPQGPIETQRLCGRCTRGDAAA